jgi:hypothetical protein
MKSGEFIFIERAQIDTLLKARGLEQTGVVDTEEIRKAEKFFL